jgi:hypothetical protein
LSTQNTPPWTDAGLHGRLSHQEGLQQANEAHQERCNKRLDLLEEGFVAHGKDIAALKEIASELKAINGTLTIIKDEIREPLKVYNKYTNFKDGLMDMGKIIIFVSVLIGAYNIVLPSLSEWLKVKPVPAKEATVK